jgi:hypothetical protein
MSDPIIATEVVNQDGMFYTPVFSRSADTSTNINYDSFRPDNMTELQYAYVKDYIKGTFYNNSPNLIIMDFTGRCWGLDEKKFDNFYHSESNEIYFDSRNSYNREDSYRNFGGWDADKGDCLWSDCNINCGLTGLLDINHSNGYNTRVSGRERNCPSRDADGNNYYSKDDKNKFEKNRKKRIFPWNGTFNDPPNAIPGYYRISRNDDDVNPRTWILKHPEVGSGGKVIIYDINFPSAGFVTMRRGDSRYDLAFILFVKYVDRNEFLNDIIENNINLANNIINEKYGKNGMEQCMGVNSNLNNNQEWINRFEFTPPQAYNPNGTESEKNILQNAGSGKCLKLTNDNQNTKSNITKIANCDGNNLDMQWTIDKDMIRKVVGHNHVKCMDGNGNDVYLNNCDSNNHHQKWSFEGRKLIHKQSGKCLFVDDDGNAKLTDCSCKTDFDNNTNDFRLRYLDVLNEKKVRCNNKDDLNYNNIEDCDLLLNTDDRMSMKFVNWCVDNSSDPQIKDYCLSSLKDNKKYLDIYNLKYCPMGDNIIKDKYCGTYLKRRLDDKERELYNKIIRDNILNKRCSDTNKFISGNTNYKYTDKIHDRECLNNWTYYENDGKTIIEKDIENITKVRDTKNWCPIRSDINETKNCNYLFRRSVIMGKEEYDIMNNFWKQIGCVSDLPIPVFLKIKNMKIDDQKKTLIHDYLNNPSFYTRNLCYTGDTIENNTIMMPNQCIYSQNKQYKFCLTENGDIMIYNLQNNSSVKLNVRSDDTKTSKLSMQSDGNLVLYNKNGPYWSSNTAGHPAFKEWVSDNNLIRDYTSPVAGYPSNKTFGVMRNDGQFVIYAHYGKILKNLSTSTFDNNYVSNDANNAASNDCDHNNKEYNTMLFILVISLFMISIILLKPGKYSSNQCKINSNQYNDQYSSNQYKTF